MGNQFTYYDSTMASAPVLAPTAGSIIALLDACLVNGFGAKAAAGWDKVFTGTNKAAYRARTGARHYLRVLDDATTNPTEGTVTAGFAFCATAYESMSDVDTGTNAFPTGSVNHAGPKNGVSGRAWWLFADALTFYLFTDITGSGTKTGFMFGEFYSFLANDTSRTIFRHCSVSSLNAVDALDNLSANVGVATVNSWIPRGHTLVLPPVNVSITGDLSRSNVNGLKGSLLPYPNPADGGLYMAPVWISDPSTVPVNGLRGRLRGFWQFLQPTAGIVDGQTLSGTGDLAGRTFTILKPSGGAGVYLMETSATLETNT